MVTNEEESGDRVIQVGTDFDCAADFSTVSFEKESLKYLLEVVKVGLGFV